MTQTTVEAPDKDRAQIRHVRYARTTGSIRSHVRDLHGLGGVRDRPVDDGLCLLGGEVPLPDAVLLAVRQQAVPAGRGGLRQVRPGAPAVLHPVRAISLPFLLGFRLTCYYYRKAYYRAFWARRRPARCAEPATRVHRRDPVPADPAEPPPLLLASRRPDLADQHLRRRPRLPRQGRRVRHRARHADPLVNIVLIWALHPVLPLLPAHHRRAAEELLQAPRPLPACGAGSAAQHPARAVRLDLAGHAGAADLYVYLLATGAFYDPRIFN